MIITKLQGGLGNQMFQYAVAFSCNEKVKIDFSFLDKNRVSTSTFTAHDFQLNIFPNLKFESISNFQSKLFGSNKKKYKFLRLILGQKIENLKQIENEYLEIDRTFNNIYFDGYFQSEKYFIHKRNDILNCFTFSKLSLVNETIKSKIISNKNSVSLHIRRGDYLKPEVIKYHGILSNEYYETAINLINEKMENPHFFIFSNDINFVNELYGERENFTIVEGNSIGAWQDMALMSYCKHHIIANSSFSWWGAWLSKNNGIKIAPKNWFNKDVVKFDINDFVPETWLKI